MYSRNLRRSLVLCLLFAFLSMAQLNRGSFTGYVTDSTSSVIPNARITVVSTATNAKYETTTTASGQYTLPNLPPGPYQITVEAPSFKKLVRSGLTLNVTEVARIDLTLEVGQVTESVTVNAEAPRLQTESPEVGTTLSSAQLLDMPLGFSGGRSPEDFAYKVSPGVTGDSWTSHINGSLGFSKEVVLDGATVSTYLSGHFGESSVSVEAVEEFKVQTSGISAEFGRTGGGVFNFVLKSGANRVHGSAFYGLRNEALNANTFSNKFFGLPRGRDRKSDLAGSFGGPVYLPKIYNGKDRTFFYFSLERFNTASWALGSPNRNLPIPDFYDGNFSRLLGPVLAQTDGAGKQVVQGAIYDPQSIEQLANGRYTATMFPGNIIPVARFSKVSQHLNDIAKKYYLPTIKDATGQIALQNNGLFPSNTTPIFKQYQMSIKGDQNLGSRHKLSGSYTYVVRPRLLLDQGGVWSPGLDDGGPLSTERSQRTKSSLVRLSYDWTMTPRLLHHFTGFYNRMNNPNNSIHADVDGAKELGIANLSTHGFPSINWGGGPLYTLTNVGDPQFNTQAYMGSGFLYTASYSHGRHFLKMGVDIRRNSLNNRISQGGSFTFSATATSIPNETFSGTTIGYSFASYLLGIVNNAGLSDPLGTGGRRHYLGLFAQDDFKVTSRLTLNLGLRWDYQPPYTEVADRQTNWNLNKVDPATGKLGAYDFAGSCSVCTGGRYFGAIDYKLFGPRVGFAWNPAGKWTIRGAYGIFYDADLFNGFSSVYTPTFPWSGTFQLSADPVTPFRGIFNWDSGFPTDRYLPPSYNVSWANANSARMVDPNYGRDGYNQDWNLNIQREIVKGVVLDVGYVGNKGSRLINDNLNRINQLPTSVLTQYGRNLTNAVRNAADAAANGIAYPYPGYVGTVAGALRQYPQIQGTGTVSTYGAPLGFATYHSLQVTVNKQFTRGISLYGNYVWSKAMTNTETAMQNGNAGPLDFYNLGIEKALASFNRAHVVKILINGELPLGRGRALWSSAPRAVNAIIGGWSASLIANYSSGSPIGISGASSPLTNGWNGGQRVNAIAGDMKVESYDASQFNFANMSDPVNKYINTSLFSDPAPLTLGTAALRYSQLSGFASYNEDIGIQKNVRHGEKFRFQIRGELLNAFNRHTLGGINTNVRNALFGQVTSASGNRTAQLDTRIDF